MSAPEVAGEQPEHPPQQQKEYVVRFGSLRTLGVSLRPVFVTGMRSSPINHEPNRYGPLRATRLPLKPWKSRLGSSSAATQPAGQGALRVWKKIQNGWLPPTVC